MINRKIDIKDLIIPNPVYSDKYETFFEQGHIICHLDELEGEDRDKFIKLEEKQNPVHFKKFREEYPQFFK